MSSEADNDIVAQLYTLRILLFCGYAMTAATIFEFIITLRAEWEMLWMSQKNIVFFIFLGLRYGNLGSVILTNMSNLIQVPTPTGCYVMVDIASAFAITVSASLSLLFAFRSYAIWGRNRLILAVLLAIAIAKVTINSLDLFLYDSIAVESGVLRTYAVCFQSTQHVDLEARLETADAALVFVFDTIVLVLTFTKTFWAARTLGQRGYLYHLLRDGLCYYIAIETLIVWIVVFSQIKPLRLYASIVQVCQPSLSAILGQRLILSLKQARPAQITSLPMISMPGDATAETGRVTGNIGAPLCNSLNDSSAAQEEDRDHES